jgi:Cu/Ag efflux pump CusA
LQSLVAGVDGVENARAVLPILEPTIEIDVDLERAAEFQIRPGDVRRAAATLLSGIEVGSLFEDQKVFEVVVWSTPEIRQSVTSVEQLRIDAPGGPISLGDVADVTVRPNERIIQRDAVSRYVDIVADVPGGDISAVEDQIQELVAERGLPFEFHVGFVSERAELDANSRQTIVIGIAAAITIFLLLQAAFSSFRLAALMMASIPAGVVGSVAAVVLSGGEYSIGSMAGMVAIAGLTLRSGMALLKRYELLQLGAKMELGPDLVVRGAQQMMRPTMASLASVAALAVVLIVPGSRAGLEVLSPMGAALLGGVVTAGFVTLILVPAIYQAIARPAVAPELFRGEAVIDLDAETDSTTFVST